MHWRGDNMAVSQNNGRKVNLQENDKRAGDEKLVKVPGLSKIPQKVSKEILNIIPENVAIRYKIAVFERKGKKIKVAMVNPEDINGLNALRFIAEKEKFNIKIYSVTGEIFGEIIKNYSSAEKAVEDVISSFKGDEFEDIELKKEKETKIRETIQDAPVSKLVSVVIRHAIDGRASDIHIEPIEDNYRVRFRVDGILYSSLVLPKDVGRAVVSRVKILSNLKIDEKRKPQDGRFKVEDGGETVDFRVSTLPVLEGEKVAMRVLVKEEELQTLESLGLIGRNKEIFENRIKDTYGIILLTGPTGSGKTTTLYAFLRILNQEERNIVTLEDPVEYFIEGINQSQIKPEIGYTFANGLRSILRQDPNIIMVGEIRDTETAELSIHAALTGHLVFSTLHTNDAVGAIPRLIDMGIEPFLLSSSLRAVAAQRLVRRICGTCKEEQKITPSLENSIRAELKEISPDEIKKYKLDVSRGFKIYQGKGCEDCGNSGFKGRLAIFEAIEMNETFQEIITEKRGNEIELRNESKKQRSMTMKQDGILKALLGLTTVSEVERVTEASFKNIENEEQIESISK